jgi:hypothetical protein
MEDYCQCGGVIQEFDDLYECFSCKSKVWKISFGKQYSKQEAINLLSGKTVLNSNMRLNNGTFFDTKIKIELEYIA